MFLLIRTCQNNQYQYRRSLHSTMFLLIRDITPSYYQRISSLHSTMFLLILIAIFSGTHTSYALHSTMFLLIPATAPHITRNINTFTFHNVSINTQWKQTDSARNWRFTFHNVSINTEVAAHWEQLWNSLHSTMFLLIQNTTRDVLTVQRLYIPQCFY